ncbi:protein SSUH2 homolog [Hyperolius riggenbachi]|uniref:protein SSUH2 homolog n=1 Tax=Hyperolius riggenbachi TaxID=752182 RepID=UPI0035A28759
MDLTSPCVTTSSPARPQAAVSPLPSRSDFVDVNLDSPRDASNAVVVQVEMVPPARIGKLFEPLQNPLAVNHSGGITAQPSSGAKVAQNTELQARPSLLGRRSKKIESNPTSGIHLSSAPPPLLKDTSIPQVVTSQPVVGAPTQNIQVPTKNVGQEDQINAGMLCVKYSSAPLEPVPTTTGEHCFEDLDSRFTGITEAVAKQAFLDFSRSKWRYSTAPAREMNVQELQHFKIYRFILETFTEHRSCEWVTEPYMGQAADTSATRATIPRPWDIPVAVPIMFKDAVQKMVMPQTSAVQACAKCNGLGRNMCLKCHGTGRAQCMWCNGTGRRMQMEMCQHCFGNGTESCRMCQNINQQCASCSGKGRVLTYMQLTVTWKNNIYQFITDHNSEFSNELFKEVRGESIFTDEQSTVSSIMEFPDQTIIRASQNALEQHRTQFSASCRVLRQRQSIEWLPLAKVRYSWKEQQLNYFVYGKENRVFVQNYPQQCCCVTM